MTLQTTLKCLCAVFLLAILCAHPVWAHGLNIFAWLESDEVLVQCDFGQNRPAVNTAITVYDSADKKELARGKTSAQGRYAFRVPEVIRQGHGLIIVADAGQGHRGEWTMDAAELYAAASLTAGFDKAALEAAQNEGAHIHVKARPAGTPFPQAVLTPEQVKNIVHEALELKLAPIRKEIAAHATSGPTFAEIIGGIGWIIGLVGIGFYFKSRRG